MGFDIGAMAGNLSGWPQGNSQPVRPVTDLSPHVDGGPHVSSMTRGQAAASDRTCLHDSAAIVLVAVILLWIAGAFSFRNHNL